MLKGHGIEVDDHWKGAVPKVDEWWTGDSHSPIVLLQNYQEEVERNSIYNGKVLFGSPPPFSLVLPYELRHIIHEQIPPAILLTPQSCFLVQVSYVHIRMLTLKCGSSGQNDRG